MSTPSGGLEPFRRRLDLLDEQIARLLGERFQVCREVAYFKSEHDIPMMQPERVVQVRARYVARGQAAELPADFITGLFELLINATCRMEDDLMGTPEDERIAVPVPEVPIARTVPEVPVAGSEPATAGSEPPPARPRPGPPRLAPTRLPGPRRDGTRVA
ncbi:MAG TPA: chorismate mutase [Solirubrobacteraceae bacterium]|nr:chorismate mutase [Solirubrobacteraceae bacterium]